MFRYEHNAADRGELKWTPNTDDIRIAELQKAYRLRVASVYERLYGKPLDMSRLNADHTVDLLIGGSASQKLSMINESINKSIGAALLRAGRAAGMKAGDPITGINWIPRR